MNVLENPSFSVRRSGLRERRSDRYATCGSWRGLMEEARVADAEVPKHRVHCDLELSRGGGVHDRWLVRRTQGAGIGVRAHELRVDRPEDCVDNRAPISGAERWYR